MSFQDSMDGKLQAYHAWVDIWLTTKPSVQSHDECFKVVTKDAPQWLTEHQPNNSVDYERLTNIIACYKTAALAKLIPLGGRVPPSSVEWDVLSESYDPRVECSCDGLYPVFPNIDSPLLENCGCKAVESMIKVGNLASQKEEEWNRSPFFSADKLSHAMTELALCNADEQPLPNICGGHERENNVPAARAPDRRPAQDSDLDDSIHHRLYPTKERVRLCADAKYFYVVSSGASLVDPGILLAIADAGNDILIGDYCEAATDETIETLQKVGAASMAFLKTCVYAGLLSDWQFDNLVAATIHFRILGYWRDHSIPKLPGGFYGSRMTGLVVHRHIDLGLTVGVVGASLASGETITGDEFMQLMETCALFNDLIDFRGDAMRKQRENVVLRGIRGSACEYLDDIVAKCVQGAAELVRRRKINALVIMSLCNWGLMSCHHKVYELVHGTHLINKERVCHYRSTSDGSYEKLLLALDKYGTLGSEGPRATMKRKALQTMYPKFQRTPETHIAWLADVTREMLNPANLRRLVDFVHYEWNGQLGDMAYCP
ncbi:uncharacterized protein N7482_008553 [Penicillium canariense]|uniref:Uncharacterized protein n=1 Tax=Penicillium canariense TaxID=189055 RepID=A0A9W9LIN2_9EURO|nr:uncharacterized protein N7482_008553 [Penicillium canariense]KAJ5157453.1 hypothetical protein N7482_008553 [Penicillium canariense]